MPNGEDILRVTARDHDPSSLGILDERGDRPFAAYTCAERVVRFGFTGILGLFAPTHAAFFSQFTYADSKLDAVAVARDVVAWSNFIKALFGGISNEAR
jgi:hypothetical protein